MEAVCQSISNLGLQGSDDVLEPDGVMLVSDSLNHLRLIEVRM
jgi:hypothetical protein